MFKDRAVGLHLYNPLGARQLEFGRGYCGVGVGDEGKILNENPMTSAAGKAGPGRYESR